MKLSLIFSITTAIALLGYSVFLIGMLSAGANISTFNYNLLAILTVVNAVNVIHRPSLK